jgi:putative SOS response-associated peptidase YedK
MPVILHERNWPKWLREEPARALELKDMLRPYPPEEMEPWPVSKAVGNVRNNGAELLEPVAVDPEEFG